MPAIKLFAGMARSYKMLQMLRWSARSFNRNDP
jgi:hypothetical protein